MVGITPVPSQVARARRFARELGVDAQVTFEVQDYARTAFPNASFDVIWAVESACHAPDKRAFVEEARRLLRAGGRLGMLEYTRAARPLAALDEALLQSWLSGWAIPDLATGAEWSGWLRQGDFGDLHVEDITPYVVPSLRRLHRMASIAWPAALLLRRLGRRSSTQHGNIRGARDQYRALRRGLWLYSALTATAA